VEIPHQRLGNLFRVLGGGAQPPPDGFVLVSCDVFGGA
jgi:hypothetical protein